MKRFQKSLALFLALVLTALLFPAAFAAEEETTVETASPELFLGPLPQDTATASLSALVDVDELRAHLLGQMLRHETNLMLYPDFRIPYSQENLTLVTYFIRYCMPEAFVSPRESMGSLKRTTAQEEEYLEAIVLPYMDGIETENDCRAAYAALQKASDEILRSVVIATGLSDLEKALLLHDKLAVWVEYDYDNSVAGTVPDRAASAYGALAYHSATCQGYALAYRYLLDRAGIECAVCDSESLLHIWNIVTIDGTLFHADVTWDDPMRSREGVIVGGDTTGRLRHTNFLLSTDALKNNPHSKPHTAEDFDTRPFDTRYDAAWWIGIETAIQYASGSFWYIDPEGNVMRRTGDTVQSAFTLENGWADGKNYSKLSGADRYLLYNTARTVVEYDTLTGKSRTVYEPDLSALGENAAIYGFTYYEQNLVCKAASAADGAAAPVFAEFRAPYSIPGDLDGDNLLTDSDAIYLLLYSFFPETYPVPQPVDYDGDGQVTDADAIYLLFSSFFPEAYPLN